MEKVDWRLGTLHDLRRTYGTRVAKVVPMHMCREFMGHAKIDTTAEYYLAVGETVPEKLLAAFPSLNGAGSTGGNTGSQAFP